jgi:hypothetical protein
MSIQSGVFSADRLRRGAGDTFPLPDVRRVPRGRFTPQGPGQLEARPFDLFSGRHPAGSVGEPLQQDPVELRDPRQPHGGIGRLDSRGGSGAIGCGGTQVRRIGVAQIRLRTRTDLALAVRSARRPRRSRLSRRPAVPRQDPHRPHCAPSRQDRCRRRIPHQRDSRRRPRPPSAWPSAPRSF